MFLRMQARVGSVRAAHDGRRPGVWKRSHGRICGSQDNLQLNVYKSAMLHNALAPIELLTDASRSFCDRCAIGIEPNKKRIGEHLGNCLMLMTALNPHI